MIRKTLAPAFMCLLVLAGLALPAGAQQSCTFLNKSIDKQSREIAVLSDRINGIDPDLRKQRNVLGKELAVVQRERRKHRCIGDRVDDRETLRLCQSLTARRMKILGRMKGLQPDIPALRARREVLTTSRWQARKTLKKKGCNCWKPPVQQAALRGYNIAGFKADSLARCKLACDNSYQCLSVDYNWKTGACYLNNRDLTRRSKPHQGLLRKRNHPFDYHERCDVGR